MNVIQFLLQHLDTILTLLSIVAVLVLGLVYITKNGRNFINAMLLSFVTIAEKEFGAGTGALKKSQVVTAVYERLPSIMRLFISEATVSKLIDNAVQEAKVKWKENTRLAEIISSRRKRTLLPLCRATSSSGIQKPLSGFHAGEGLFSFMQENPRKIRRNNVGSKINSQNSQKSESGFDKKVSVGFQNFPIYFHP